MKFNLAIRKLRIVKERYLISFFLQNVNPGLSDIFQKHLQLDESRRELKVHILISALAKGLSCLRAGSVPDLVCRRVWPGVLN